MDERKSIPLANGATAYVSPEDYDEVIRHRWYKTSHGYAARTDQGGYLHRMVNKTPQGLSTDHISGDKLDCTRGNLRTVTSAQNAKNVHIQNREGKSSQYKGVFFHVGKGVDKSNYSYWIAYINNDGEREYLGKFVTELDAALAYNQASARIHGEYAKLNKLPLDFQAREVPEKWKKKKVSQFMGVSLHKASGLWYATKTIKGMFHHFGYFKTEAQAAIAYDFGVSFLLGSDTKLNSTAMRHVEQIL